MCVFLQNLRVPSLIEGGGGGGCLTEQGDECFNESYTRNNKNEMWLDQIFKVINDYLFIFSDY